MYRCRPSPFGLFGTTAAAPESSARLFRRSPRAASDERRASIRSLLTIGPRRSQHSLQAFIALRSQHIDLSTACRVMSSSSASCDEDAVPPSDSSSFRLASTPRSFAFSQAESVSSRGRSGAALSADASKLHHQGARIARCTTHKPSTYPYKRSRRRSAAERGVAE